MKQKIHVKRLGLTLTLSIVAIFLAFLGFSPASAAGEIDFTLEGEAPAHIDVGASYLVRLAFYNLGTSIAPDAAVTAILPSSADFITATDRWGDPLPPDTTDGNALTWDFDTPICQMPQDACCGHILITLKADDALMEGEILTTTASITTTGVESDTTNNSTSVSSVIYEMAGSTKRVQAGHITPGEVLTYNIRLDLSHQLGGVNERWVTFSDTLPFSHQVRFLGWKGTMTETTFNGQQLQWQGMVRAGEPLTLQYRLGIEGDVPPGTIITNIATLDWIGHHMNLGPVTSVVTMPHGVLALGPNEGGQIQHQYGVSLTIPPGAVTDTTRFQVGPLFTDTQPIPPGELWFANRAFEMTASRFGEPVGHFNHPLTITINYTDTDVWALKRETLRLWTRTGPEGPWASMGEPARVMSGSLEYTTTHFSQFALFGETRFTHRIYLPLLVR